MPHRIANAYPTIKQAVDDLGFEIEMVDDEIEELRAARSATCRLQTFHNTSDDYAMAQFCWERADHLAKHHRDFVEGMQAEGGGVA